MTKELLELGNEQFQKDLSNIQNMNELELVEELCKRKRKYSSNEKDNEVLVKKIKYRLIDIDDKGFSKRSKEAMMICLKLFRDELVLAKERGWVLPSCGGRGLSNPDHVSFEIHNLIECFTEGKYWFKPENSKRSKFDLGYHSEIPYMQIPVDLDVLINFLEVEITNLQMMKITNYLELQNFNNIYKIRFESIRNSINSL